MPYKDPEKRKEYLRQYRIRRFGEKEKKIPLTQEEKLEVARQRSRLWRINNPDKIVEHRIKYSKNGSSRRSYTKWRHKLRREVVDMYGGMCLCCEEEEFWFLDIEHENGGGAAERAKFCSYSVYLSWLKKDYRDGIRILCHNCNKARRHGKCPHNRGVVKGEIGNIHDAGYPEDAKKRAIKKYRHRLRRRVVEFYGGFCACCGESQYEFLAIDHINGGGTKHIRSFKSYVLYLKWLIEFRRPEFRILCHNCNRSRARLGQCPHGNGI